MVVRVSQNESKYSCTRRHINLGSLGLVSQKSRWFDSRSDVVHDLEVVVIGSQTRYSLQVGRRK